MLEYDKLLERVKQKLPEKTGLHERFQMPVLDSFVEGNKTILKNMNNVASYLNRDIANIVKFLSRELATSAAVEGGGRVVFVGKFLNKILNARLELYVNTFIKCRECGSPDTKIESQDRVHIMHCMACQAKRPLPKLK